MENPLMIYIIELKYDDEWRPYQFIYYKITFYRWSFDGLFLHCLREDESVKALQEAHLRACSAHQFSLKLYFQVKKNGTGQQWLKTPWIMQKDVMLIKFMKTLFINY